MSPGVDVRAAVRDLMKDGAVGIDDIGENTYDSIRDAILDSLGHAAGGFDLRTQRIATAMGPVFVLRNHHVWSAANTRRAVLSEYGWS